MTEEDFKLESISIKVKRVYSSIGESGEGGSADLAWEYCHRAFMQAKKDIETGAEITEERKDYLALHLAVYLANWGMYRASGFLLRHDYKCHLKVIDVILNQEYKCLWEYNPSINEVDVNIIASKAKDAYERIAGSYSGKKPTDTLVTKIMLVTFACIPAYDTYVKKAIALIKTVGYGNEIKQEDYKDLVQSINPEKVKSSVICYSEWIRQHKDAFTDLSYKIDPNLRYPIMKKLDMFLFSLGFEYDLLTNDVNHNKRYEYQEHNKIDMIIEEKLPRVKKRNC